MRKPGAWLQMIFCIKAKARCGSVKQSSFSGLVCSGLHSISGAQWLSGRVLDSRPRGHGFEAQRRHCVVALSKTYNSSLVLVVQSRKTRPYITERLLMKRKESRQAHKYTAFYTSNRGFAVPSFNIINDTIVKL